jgi:hypothetical protein
VAALASGEAEYSPGTAVTSVGIDPETQLSSWTSRIVSLESFAIDSGRGSRPFLITARPPRHGRSGGGLFLGNGELVGVCIGYFQLHDGPKSGVFASIATVCQLIREHGLETVADHPAPATRPQINLHGSQTAVLLLAAKTSSHQSGDDSFTVGRRRASAPRNESRINPTVLSRTHERPATSTTPEPTNAVEADRPKMQSPASPQSFVVELGVRPALELPAAAKAVPESVAPVAHEPASTGLLEQSTVQTVLTLVAAWTALFAGWTTLTSHGSTRRGVRISI